VTGAGWGASMRRRCVLAALGVFLGAFAALPAQAGAAQGVKGNAVSLPESLSSDGRYLAFVSASTNLTPEGVQGIFVRDTVGGLTVLASRADGVSGTPGNHGVTGHSISADGGYVAFDSTSSNLDPSDPDSREDVYVRDLGTGTTTLVSRANGVAGEKGNGDSLYPAISADGRYVAFVSIANNLSPDDPDVNFDVYVRDLQLGTTMLASRADGLTGAKQNGLRQDILQRVGISASGTRVAFLSDATNLTSDPGTGVDVYVRDIAAGTTTLASRANGVAGARAGGGNPSLSADGQHVSFLTVAPLTAADTNGTGDVYERDMAAATTTLVSRADGPAGAVSNNAADPRSISGDGRYVAFRSESTNLHPDDSSSDSDIYVRDVVGGRTMLASRSSGPSGAKGNNYSFAPWISADGRFVAFNSSATNLSPDDPDTTQDAYVRDLQENITSLESRASAGHARPKGATPFRASLVVANDVCTAPDRQHGPSLAFPSCASPVQSSQSLTVGNPDADGAAANFTGFVRLGVLPGTAGGADDADLAIDLHMSDVRCQVAATPCGPSNASGGSDYTGEVQLDLSLRITDKATLSPWAGYTQPATVADLPFPATAGCSATPDPAIGAECALVTSADALVPGSAPEGKRAIWEVAQVQVLDGGADGIVASSPNHPFARQGVFVP
jgi:Tol biopolymer transport system component